MIITARNFEKYTFFSQNTKPHKGKKTLISLSFPLCLSKAQRFVTFFIFHKDRGCKEVYKIVFKQTPTWYLVTTM